MTVVDKTNHHLFQPLLYQVATGIMSEGAIAPATRDVLRRHRNVSVLMAEVTGFDLDAREVLCRQPDGRPLTLPYDSLVVAAGAGGSYFGHDEFAQWAPGMKTLDDAVRQRTRILGALEMAELEQDDAARAAWLSFVVVGGGPTGVEIAGQIAELGRRAIGDSYTRFGPNDVRVILCDGGKEILATFGDRLSQVREGYAHRVPGPVCRLERRFQRLEQRPVRGQAAVHLPIANCQPAAHREYGGNRAFF